MIHVLIWNENIDDSASTPKGEEVRKVHPDGIHNTLKSLLGDSDFSIRTSVLSDPECGLSEEILCGTDVLIFWSHIGHDKLSDEAAERVLTHVHKGMGFIALHSAHMSKPFCRLMGTSCTLKWRDDDTCRVWNVLPTHPIAQGIPESFELYPEEMYGEPFDVARPDDIVFMSWFSEGEVLRSGMTWTRGYGKVFYFQPGHETNTAYKNDYIGQIIKNAIRWAAPTLRRESLDCIHAVRPEA